MNYAASVIDFDGALSCTKPAGLTLMEEQRTGPGVKASTFFKQKRQTTFDRPSADPMQCWASLELLWQCAAAHTQSQRRPKLHKTNVEANRTQSSIDYTFYGMFYSTVYDYNSHIHIIPITPRYNQYQASFSPFRSLREKSAWEQGYALIREIQCATIRQNFTWTLHLSTRSYIPARHCALISA